MSDIKTYNGDFMMNDRIAQILGIKMGEYKYKPLQEGLNTIFTAPLCLI